MVARIHRRDFLIGSSVVAGGLAVGVVAFAKEEPQPSLASFQRVNARPWLLPREGGLEINPWIVIAPDSSVTVIVNQTDVGQGVLTSNAMMICEELECDWSKVSSVYADPNRHAREHNLYDHLRTDSSSSVRLGLELYQKVGANARERLRVAAARRWNVSSDEVSIKNGVLRHEPTRRSLTYGAVAAEAASVTLDHEPAIKSPDQYSLIGTRMERFDVGLKSRGQAVYGIDIRLPGMLYAAIAMPPAFGGTLKGFDFDAVRGKPGVIKAVPMRGIGTAEGIAVVADSWWRAKTALEAMPIEWNDGPNAKTTSKDLFDLCRSKLDAEGPIPVDEGDIGAAFVSAHQIVEAEFRLPHQAHAAMEPASCTVQITPDKADIWFGSQQPDIATSIAAKITGMPIEKIFVHSTFLGGGFGGGGKHGHLQQALTIAKVLDGRPVKVVWTRENNLKRDNGFHPMGMSRMRAALDAAGVPTAIHIRIAGNDAVEGAPLMEFGKRKAKIAGQLLRGLQLMPYRFPNRRVEVNTVKTLVPCGPWRSTGSYATVFYLESFIDELAHAAGKDPIAYRRMLIEASPPDAFEANSKDAWLKVLDAAASSNPDWSKPLPKGVGIGFAIDDRKSVVPRGTVIVAMMATVSVNKSGRATVERLDVTHECGRILVNPEVAERQVRGMMAWGMSAALNCSITIGNGGVIESNFHDYMPLTLAEFPKELNVNFIKTERLIAGIGEEAVPLIGPAICNAVFSATGQRIRSLPLKDHDLSWS